ncbi:hypothetical protein L1F28_11635 [Arthrospira platensis NCB002]|nr:hypothetical protein [Arthrospira platensis]MDF2209394.1 hypothetical protein [Arthrospira platensis NCB002]
MVGQVRVFVKGKTWDFWGFRECLEKCDRLYAPQTYIYICTVSQK